MNRSIEMFGRLFLGFLCLVASCDSSSSIPDISRADGMYYVSPKGNDENLGSFESPWRTIQKAVNSVSPGSIINVMEGVYVEEVCVNISGTKERYITLQNYKDDEVVISGNKSAKQLMLLLGVSYWKIKGLTFADCLGSYSVGLKISNKEMEASHHIEVEANVFRNLYASSEIDTYPPNVYAGAITVAGYNGMNEIHDIVIKDNIIKDCRTGWTEAIGITGNVNGFQILDNVICNTGNIGINASGHWKISDNPLTDYPRNGLIAGNKISNCRSLVEGGAGIYLDGSSDIIVERNLSHNNVYGITIGCEVENNVAANNVIRNNICYQNDGFGIGLMGWSAGNRVIKNCQILNNTTFANGIDESKRYLGEFAMINAKNISVMNNIFYSQNSNSNIVYFYDNIDELEMDFNQYYSVSMPIFSFKGNNYTDFSFFKIDTKLDSSSELSDPLFCDKEGKDFHLNQNSPCIDNGCLEYSIINGEVDFDNNVRVVGMRIDKGALEYQY